MEKNYIFDPEQLWVIQLVRDNFLANLRSLFPLCHLVTLLFTPLPPVCEETFKLIKKITKKAKVAIT